MKLPYLLPVAKMYHYPSTLMCDTTQSIAKQQRSLMLCYPEFLLGFYDIGVMDRIIGHMIEFDLQPSPFHRDQADSRCAQSTKPLIT